MMVSRLQGLRQKLTSASPFQRSLSQTDVDSASNDVLVSQETRAVVKAFKLQSAAELKVVLSALILSECVYKLVDIGEKESAKAASAFMSQFPPGLVSLLHVQSANTTVPHRYMLGDDGQSLYMVFMGTKHMRDLISDANFLQEAVWKSKEPDKQSQATALAHRGFLGRARHIPVEALYNHARSQGKRLVLCGHSLGGAVALLCTLRLLQGLSGSPPSLHCICFGTPAIGNAALAALVSEFGWESHILNFILPEDIIPRMLALPAVPTPEQAATLQQRANADSEQKQQQQADASDLTGTKPIASAAASSSGAVRNRLQNLRAILTAHKPSGQMLHSAVTQPENQQPHAGSDEISADSLNAAADASYGQNAKHTEAHAVSDKPADPSTETARSDLSAERSSSSLMQSMRGFTRRLPGSNRTQPVPDSTLQSPVNDAQAAALSEDGAAQSSKEGAGADKSQQQQQQPQQEAEGSDTGQASRLRRLQNRVQGVWEGASSRAKAMRALLPAYPAYVHIGSHQILLPASPAMSEALKDAQQEGLAEERQQALIMHRMSAYRGRAAAICRGVFHWKPADAAAQIGLSSTLAPPITLIQASVTLPPLPMTAMPSKHQAEQAPKSHRQGVPRSQAMLAQQQGVLHHTSKAQRLATQIQQAVPHYQQQSQPNNAEEQQCEAQQPGATLGLLKPAMSTSRQAGQTKSGQPTPAQAESARQGEESQAGAAAQQVSTLSQHQSPSSLPKRWRWQRSKSSSQGPPSEDSSAVGRQGLAQASQAEQQVSSGDQPTVSRWLPPVGGRWQGKQKPPPKVLIQIRVQGSVHSMPVKAQLHVMGQLWCRAGLLPSGVQPHRLHDHDRVVSVQPTSTSWRQVLASRLPWLQPQSVQQQPARQDVMLLQAEVPLSLLQEAVDMAEQQQKDQVPQTLVERHQLQVTGPRQPSGSSCKAPAMLLKLQTDFQTREQAVQVQLPVVWLLGTDQAASQAVWHMLTSAVLKSDSHEPAAQSSSSGASKAGTALQSAQHRVRRALNKLRQESPQQQQQPQLATAVMSGVHYVHIQAMCMRPIDMLSCLLLLLAQFARDRSTIGPVEQMEASRQSLPARLRAAYHKHELQELQTRLQSLGPPSGLLLVHNQPADTHLGHVVRLITKQASILGIMKMGISRGSEIGSEGLLGIPADDWVMLPEHIAEARTGLYILRLQQRLQAALSAVVAGLHKSRSKL